MPTVANGIDYDTDLAHARGENLELELRDGGAAVRLLGFVNHARMGSYAEAIAAFRAGGPIDITAHRARGRVKYGLGVNLEGAPSSTLRLYARAGWNDGATESFAYTEVDDSFSAGLDWRAGERARLGVAVVSNGLSADHAAYLALGGAGFLLGDGALRYGRETIVEAYCTTSAGRGLFPAIDVQLVDHPGYNRARGPLVLGAFRLHMEL
jgi:hypothetical protein